MTNSVFLTLLFNGWFSKKVNYFTDMLLKFFNRKVKSFLGCEKKYHQRLEKFRWTKIQLLVKVDFNGSKNGKVPYGTP